MEEQARADGAGLWSEYRDTSGVLAYTGVLVDEISLYGQMVQDERERAEEAEAEANIATNAFCSRSSLLLSSLELSATHVYEP